MNKEHSKTTVTRRTFFFESANIIKQPPFQEEKGSKGKDTS
jgi:hypothetical protein